MRRALAFPGTAEFDALEDGGNTMGTTKGLVLSGNSRAAPCSPYSLHTKIKINRRRDYGQTVRTQRAPP